MSTLGLKLRSTPEGIAARAAGHRARLDALVAEMHAAYTAGASLSEIGRRYKRNRSCIRELFVLRDLPVREPGYPLPARHANGCIIAAAPFSEAEIEAMIQAETKFRVPPALKREWRQWSHARRSDFVNRLRAKLALTTERPLGPFSANVTPFDYTTVAADAICAAMNVGTNSRTAKIKINICSQGVIYKGELWFWCHKSGYERGQWNPITGRPSLHRTIWEQAHGRTVPAGHVLRFIDGNHNNLVAENLTLLTRDQVARENQAAALQKKSRALTALLLNRSQNTDHDHTRTLQHLKGL